MSIDMYLGDSLSQSGSVTNRCEKHIQDYEEIIKIIFEFEATVFSLQGKTYNSARMYFLFLLTIQLRFHWVKMEQPPQYAPKFPADNVYLLGKVIPPHQPLVAPNAKAHVTESNKSLYR